MSGEDFEPWVPTHIMSRARDLCEASRLALMSRAAAARFACCERCDGVACCESAGFDLVMCKTSGRNDEKQAVKAGVGRGFEFRPPGAKILGAGARTGQFRPPAGGGPKN